MDHSSLCSTAVRRTGQHGVEELAGAIDVPPLLAATHCASAAPQRFSATRRRISGSTSAAFTLRVMHTTDIDVACLKYTIRDGNEDSILDSLREISSLRNENERVSSPT